MHSDRIFSVEKKIKIINLIENNESLLSVSKRFDIQRSVIQDWQRLYNSEGIKGLLRKRKKTRYSKEFKEMVIREHIQNKISFRMLAIKYGLRSYGMVANWFRDYTIGKKTYSNRNQRNQRMKDGRKTTQLERVEIAQWAIANDYAYHEAAERFNVSYQQVYTWVKKLKKDGTDALSDRRGKNKSTPLTELDKAKLEIKELKARNKYLEMKRDLSKKLQEIQRREN